MLCIPLFVWERFSHVRSTPVVRQAEGHSIAQFLSQFNLSQGKLRAPSGNPVLRFQWEWCRGFVEDGGAKQRDSQWMQITGGRTMQAGGTVGGRM